VIYMPKTRKTSSSSAGGTRVNKSAWIRGQPAATPAKEVVAKAKQAGIKLSIAQVYTARSSAKKKGIVKRGPGRKPAAEMSALAVKRAGGGAASSDLRHQFVSIAVRIGTEEAQRLLDRLVDVETSMGSSVRR
jgi:hypothetical protein